MEQSSRLPRPDASVFADLVELEHPGIEPQVLERCLRLAVQIAREGREGRKIGTVFTIGDAEAVLERSRPLILDPLAGHPDAQKRVTDPGLRETIKELAQLDGAFVVSGAGVFLSGARYIDVLAEDVELPLGFGSRHMAGASISKATECLSIVVSESSMVRVFFRGELVSEVIPELWMLRNDYASQMLGELSQQSKDEVTVVTRRDQPDPVSKAE